LRDTIERHRDYTGSTVADRILRSWDTEISSFRKVMPVDYKRVLNVIEQSIADGLSEEETVEEIMKAARV
jgi:glutamate synthase domain-containing protein 3